MPEHPAPDGSPTAKRALRFFDGIVWRNPEVCSNCFARVRRRTVGVVATPEGRRIEIDDSWRTPDAFLGTDLEDPPAEALGVQPLAKPRTTCLACGSVGALSTGDTLSRREALSRVPALADRIREAGYDVDGRKLRRIVRHLKSHEDYHGDDRRVFAAAAALAVAPDDRAGPSGDSEGMHRFGRDEG
jgi:hypothetical protein